MHDDKGNDIIIVSDLHASVYYDTGIGALTPGEDFLYDAAFARFLDDLSECGVKEGRNWQLLILGDLLDFLETEMRSQSDKNYALDRSEANTLSKLERIAQAHGGLFGALGRFVSAGFSVHIVPGNHDIEFMYPAVQNRFRELVGIASGQSGAAKGITFHPWIYYIPGLLYAEHGHQYHDINWFSTLLRPELDRTHGRVDLPIAARFHEYMASVIQSLDPDKAHGRLSLGKLLRSLATKPVRAARILPLHLRFLGALLSYIASLSGAGVAARRAAYHNQALSLYASEAGLSYPVLVALDQLAFIVARGIGKRLLQRLLVEPILHWLPSLSGLFLLFLTWRKTRSVPLLLLSFATAAGTVIRQARRPWKLAPRTSSYMYSAAQAIHNLLEAEENDCPYYVFGHTHIAEELPLGFNASSPMYLNPGTWTKMVYPPPEEGHIVRFPFVQITREPENTKPVAQLLIWNDAEGRIEHIPSKDK